MRIYVGNINFDTDEARVREAFEEFGTVDKIFMAMDRETKRPKGFAFLEMEEGGRRAIREMNGKELDGRVLKVDEAKPRAAP